MLPAWDEWTSSGERHAASGLWHRVDGDGGAWTTFLHGFPTHSLDWAPLLDEAGDRAPGRRRLVVDLLGFGASARPRPISFGDQIAALQRLWADRGVDATMLVCHDYSVSIAQEILWRMSRGTWDGPRITGILLLNGGLFYSKQARLGIQNLLALPVLGPIVAALAGHGRFAQAMHRISVQPPAPADIDALWRGMVSGPKRAVATVSAYHRERRRREADWTAALAAARIPVTMAWGTADPVSGLAMADHAQRRCKAVQQVRRDDVGHYPQLEAPAWVARWLLRMERRTA